MSMNKSIGVIELSSVGIGYQIQDEMLKAASVDLLIARTICSGKYLIVVGGLVSDVQAAIAAGLKAADEAIIDHLVLPNVHESVFPALGQSVTLGGNHAGALGVIETFSGTSALAAADAAAGLPESRSSASTSQWPLGAGPRADDRLGRRCPRGVDAAAAAVRERGLLVSKLIPRPQRSCSRIIS